MAARQVADAGPCLLVDPEREEAIELPPPVVEDAKRRIAGFGQLSGPGEHHFQHALEVEAGEQGATDFDQPAQPRRIDGRQVHGAMVTDDA